MSAVNDNEMMKEPSGVKMSLADRIGADDARSVAFACFLTVLSFAMGRVEMTGAFFPCGIALMSAALKRSSLNIYLIIPTLAGMLTLWRGGTYIWGDVIAAAAARAVFMILAKRGLPDFYRMIICVSIVIISNSVYYTAAHILYRLDLKLLLLETITVGGLYYIFHVFFSLSNMKETFRGSVEGGIVSIAGICALIFCGLTSWRGASYYITEYIPMTAGFLCVLILGYKLGISAGITASAIIAVIFYLCSIIPMSQVIIFICAGLTAGFFRGLNKYTTAACFAAVCLVFGLACTGALGALPAAPPLIAALIFALIPSRMMKQINEILRRLVSGNAGVSSYELQEGGINTANVKDVLDGYKECFGSLAKLYDIGKDQRSIISHQFRGMQQVVNQLEMDIKSANKGRLACVPVNTEYKYNIDVGTSGYARLGDVSGDSYICKTLSDGRYIIILSDGMGKGEAAAMESSLAVKTLANLIEAGFDVEIALRTLNSILLLKSEDEIFSTVDIGIFDKTSGKLKLYKIGAASTFIKRGEKVSAVKMAALPMGIVDGLKIDFVSLKLQPGDQIIMVSDGVTDSARYANVAENGSGTGAGSSEHGENRKTGTQNADNGCEWLCETVRAIKSKDPSTMADLIINKAVENYGVREKDDLTVISAVIKDTSLTCSKRA